MVLYSRPTTATVNYSMSLTLLMTKRLSIAVWVRHGSLVVLMTTIPLLHCVF